MTAGKTGTVPVFETGDVVAFIGDSITHNGMYHADIFQFYATRFPDRSFRIFNCGICGDTARDVLGRYDRDIAIHCPNVATIMLGMNDVGRENYGADKNTPEHLAAREESLRIYRESMDKLASRLTADGCRIIFITPTIYDQTAEIECENAYGVNDALARCAEFVKELASKYNSPVIDFHTPMNEVNRRLQQQDPSATAVGADRTHPGEAGHLIMTREFLRAQGMPKLVSRIGLDALEGKVTDAINCRIGPDRLQIGTSGVSFDCLENALPYPLNGEERVALEWIPLLQEFSQQMLQITNLAAGRYTLQIDDQTVGTWTAEEFAAGIDLADNAATPQHQQAMNIWTLNRQRHEIACRLRAIPEIRCRYLAGVDPLPADDGELLKLLDGVIEKEKGKPWYDHMKNRVQLYMETCPKTDELQGQIDALYGEIIRAARPVSHHWSIRPAC